RSRRNPSEPPFEVSDAVERLLQALARVLASNELFDRVPFRLELHRVRGWPGKRVAQSAGAERRARAVEEGAKASIGGAVGGLEQLESRDRGSVQTPPFAEAERLGRADVLRPTRSHLPRVSTRRRGGRSSGKRRRGARGAGGIEPADGPAALGRAPRDRGGSPLGEQHLPRAEQGE